MNALNCYKSYPIYTEEKSIAPNIVAKKTFNFYGDLNKLKKERNINF